MNWRKEGSGVWEHNVGDKLFDQVKKSKHTPHKPFLNSFFFKELKLTSEIYLYVHEKLEKFIVVAS